MSLAFFDRIMPTVQIEGYKFRFYSSDVNEPPHMHVLRGGSVAKVWLQPVQMEYNRGYSQRDMRQILQIAQERQQQLLELWHGHFRT